MRRTTLDVPIAVWLALWLLMFTAFITLGCSSESPLAPTEPTNISKPQLNASVESEPETSECDLVGLKRSQIRIRIDGFKVFLFVPIDPAFGEPYFKLEGYRNNRAFKANEEVSIGRFAPGVYRFKLCAETLHEGRIYQCDRHWIEFEILEPREPVCVEWETREVPCPTQTAFRCKPKPCFTEVCIRWE